jgi:NAD(P)-dependent dehydrogenase (short-subunit alcohol dehydrogenase family)
MRLRPIDEQVVVLLGASSGIGREAALRLAKRGARVIVAARDRVTLASLVEEIQGHGGQAVHVVCDVTDAAEVEGVAAVAAATYGRIDTWVNLAAVSVYARFEDTTSQEFRRVLDVNVMGQVHGARAALPRLRAAGGGALIAIASVESRVAMPLHSSYAASKFAVEGFPDALRRELIEEGAPIVVTSIKPATINTPFFDHTRTKLGVKPRGMPPVYQPSVVADAVLYAASHPVREIYCGGAGRLLALGQAFSPRLVDAVLSRAAVRGQHTDQAKSPEAPDNLFAPAVGEVRTEDHIGRPRRLSLYTWAATHPGTTLAAGAALTGTALLLRRAHGTSPIE